MHSGQLVLSIVRKVLPYSGTHAVNKAGNGGWRDKKTSGDTGHMKRCYHRVLLGTAIWKKKWGWIMEYREIQVRDVFLILSWVERQAVGLSRSVEGIFNAIEGASSSGAPFAILQRSFAWRRRLTRVSGPLMLLKRDKIFEVIAAGSTVKRARESVRLSGKKIFSHEIFFSLQQLFIVSYWCS